MSDQSSGGQADRITAEIAALASLGIRDLKSRWRAWYDTEPPARISRELLTSAIAYLQLCSYSQDKRLCARTICDCSEDQLAL